MSLDPEPGRASGYCRDCGQFGRGRFDDIRTALTDWIRDHVGCPGTLDNRPERDE
ncbi:hypothetical protein ACFXDE_02240 [Kitasatospora sp. NPDC059408]|uniref:hypothetical protein n=1 Tax=Kitasatospora sp. NPDC059408 TaxID=3346823 RepID=UPI0036C7ECC0